MRTRASADERKVDIVFIHGDSDTHRTKFTDDFIV
jgi:hypothetical protein